MCTADIMTISILISVLISLLVASLGFSIRDKKYSKFEQEKEELRADIDRLKSDFCRLEEHYREHLKGHRY